MQRTVSWLMFGLLCLVWVAVQSQQPDQAVPPRLSAHLEQHEAQAARAHFFADSCFADLREHAKPVTVDLKAAEYYRVDIPATPTALDAFSYVVHVHRLSRLAYLQRDGGYAGVHEVHGPFELWPCLRQALQKTPLPDLAAKQSEPEINLDDSKSAAPPP
jgi:hypothetical protein